MEMRNGGFRKTRKDEIRVSGIEMQWHPEQGTCTFERLPVAMMWVDTTLAGLMSGVQAMVGTERFLLALQAEGRKSVEADWEVISQSSDFPEGFKAIANIAAVAGWGKWEITVFDRTRRECQFRVRDSWEGRYQRALGVCWGSGMLAGKMAGYCSKLFGTNCWADQSAFVARGDGYDEFTVKPSLRSVEKEIESLLATDEATRADMAVALRKLEQEIIERTRVEEALRESEGLFRSQFEFGNIGIANISAEKSWLRVNPCLCHMLGYSEKELQEKTWPEMTHPEDLPADVAQFNRMLTGGIDSYEMDKRFFRKDGSIIHTHLTTSCFRNSDRSVRFVIASLQDITERQEAEAALRTRTEQLEMLRAVSEEITRELDLDRLLDLILRRAVELAKAEGGVIVLWDETEKALLPRLRIGDYWTNVPIRPIPLGEGVVGHVAANRKGIIINDYLAWPGARPITLQFTTVTASLGEPLLYRDKLIGAISLAHTAGKGTFTEQHGTFLRLLANEAAVAIENARLYETAQQELADRRRAEVALRESEEKYRTILESMEEGYYEVDLTGNLTFFNDSVCRLLGYSRNELMGMNNRAYTHREDTCRLYQVFNGVYTTGESARGIDWRIIRKDGAVCFTEASVSLIRDSNGQAAGFRGIARDVTDRRQAEEARRESEARYRDLIETARDVIFTLSAEGRLISLNRAFEVLTGWSPAEWIGKSFVDLVDPGDLLKARKQFEKVMEGTFTEPVELRIRTKHGAAIHGEFIASPQVKNQKVIGILGIARDITERKRAEEVLRESEEKYRLVIQNAQEMILIIQDRTLKFINPETEKITGYSSEEFASKPFVEFIHPDDKVMVGENHQKRLRGEPVPPVYVFRIVVKDGRTKWVEANAVVINWNGRPATLNFLRDITERKRVEAALQESEEKYRSLVANATDAIFIVQDGLITFPNPITLALVGYSQEEMATLPFIDLVHPQDRAMVLDNHNRRLNGEEVPSTSTFRVLNKQGEELWGQLNAALTTWGGRPAILCFIRDITPQKRLEAQYLHAQKMEAIGTLAGGIAHDFNNILSAILGYAELAAFNIEEGTQARYHLEQSIRAAHRARDLVRQILAFSRQGRQERRLLNMNPIVKEGLRFLRASLPATIEIRQRIEEDLGMIESDPTQVHQVLMNLCTNAAHAMGEKGGVLEVSLANLNVDKGMAAAGGIDPGAYVRLRVSDTGEGIPPEILKRIFDPYFTTKEAGKGTGLGLSVVHGIVKSCEGGIAVSSEVGKGSTFDVYFPKIESAGSSRKPEEVEPLPIGTHERVLFVDDEEAIVDVGRKLLEYLGYDVVTRTSSREALELFRVQAARFDLVITDMTMPNMTGDKLAQEMLKVRPGIPIVLCTGFSEHITEAKAKAMGVSEVAMKPLAMNALAKTIRRALDSKKKEKR
jgi:PAS domain S-box-containing protein